VAKLDDSVHADLTFDSRVLQRELLGATGEVDVLVRLTDESLAQADVAESAQATAVAAVERGQSAFIARAKRADRSVEVLGSAQRVLNAVMLRVDAQALGDLAADPSVERISRVRDYELHLDETVPYIGATEVQTRGYDGAGVRVAVLDSGIDYTHAAMGGAGTAEAYEAAYGTDPSDPAYQAKINAYQQRLPMMNRQRLTPELPAWPATCFYPMNKKRKVGENWFLLPFSARNQMMSEHARSGMEFAGKVTQLITVGVGLEDWEWGVTLWARNPQFLKDIVYRMRFDEASAKYAEFGPFYTGYKATAEEILKHCRIGASASA
jgi:hypothetical protein